MSVAPIEDQTDAEVVAAAIVWLAAWTATSEQVKTQAEAAARALWEVFDGWYDDRAVAQVAKEAAAASVAAQQTAAGMAVEYVTNVSDIVGIGRPSAPVRAYAPVRNGTGLELVHSRPAHQFRRAIAVGKTVEQATDIMVDRGITLTLTDVVLQDRGASQRVMKQFGIERYRRVIRPELSKTGTCGLCIAASGQLYKTDQLMPIHPPSCNCIVMPVTADLDPGRVINDRDIKELYAEAVAVAGSTSAEDLRLTRFAVNEHGEFGPVLTREEDEFRGRDRVALEDDPERARRLLTKVAPVLRLMRSEGEPMPGALAYQEELYERLTAIAA